MRAFHNDPAIKQMYIDRVAWHRAMDDLVQGLTGQGGRGCAVWCTLHDYNHSAYEQELGIPMELAFLEDCIFEQLPFERAQQWPERFLSAIPVGADLSMVVAQFSQWAGYEKPFYIGSLMDAGLVLWPWLGRGRGNRFDAAKFTIASEKLLELLCATPPSKGGEFEVEQGALVGAER